MSTPPLPRWKLEITPQGTETMMQAQAHEEGVTYGEIVHYLIRLLAPLSANPGRAFPTVAQQQEAQRRARVLAESPATRIFVRGEQQLWIGDAAPRPVGWTDAGPVPPDVKRPCEWALDPKGFETAYCAAAGASAGA